MGGKVEVTGGRMRLGGRRRMIEVYILVGGRRGIDGRRVEFEVGEERIINGYEDEGCMEVAR